MHSRLSQRPRPIDVRISFTLKGNTLPLLGNMLPFLALDGGCARSDGIGNPNWAASADGPLSVFKDVAALLALSHLSCERQERLQS